MVDGMQIVICEATLLELKGRVAPKPIPDAQTEKKSQTQETLPDRLPAAMCIGAKRQVQRKEHGDDENPRVLFHVETSRRLKVLLDLRHNASRSGVALKVGDESVGSGSTQAMPFRLAFSACCSRTRFAIVLGSFT